MSSSTATASASIRAWLAAIGTLGVIAILCLLFASFVGVRHGISVISVLTARDASSNADPTAGLAGVDRYAASYEIDTIRIANRDFWRRPQAPPPPPPPPRPDPEPVVRDNTPPPPPPPPSIYGGPGIEAMMGDTVWFERGVRLSAGQSNDEVEVIATRPPWSATLLWKGVEFEVGYFDRDMPGFWIEPSAGATYQSPEPDPAEEPKTDTTSDGSTPPASDTPEVPPAGDPGGTGAETTGELL